MSNLLTLFCNLLWFLSTLPGWIRFRLACLFPKQTQQQILQKILKQNRDTHFLTENEFDRLAPRKYEDFLPYIESMMQGRKNVLTAEDPILLEPTGGTTSGTKLIPYTFALKKEFQRAIDPWICGLFMKWPSLLFGRHYWCITPSTTLETDSEIPIGFDTDAAYLNRSQQILMDHILAVPDEIKKCTDPISAEYLTLFYLLKSKNLRLISIWHPSLLVIQLKTLKIRFDELIHTLETGGLPDDIKSPIPVLKHPRRARQLREMGFNPARIWKRLKIISCWAGASGQEWIDQLELMFPTVTIQPKGLIATEGISTIPLGTKENIAAVGSHYYEFENEESKERLPLWNLEKGAVYHLILTTGGGLYRYCTHDLVKVSGMFGKTPCLEFQTRNNMTSDLVGEKIALSQAQLICSSIPIPRTFALIAPEAVGNSFRYVLYLEAMNPVPLDDFFEKELNQNFHYHHARNIGQLEHSVVRYIHHGVEKTYAYLEGLGQQRGNIKLSALRLETNWGSVLEDNLNVGEP